MPSPGAPAAPRRAALRTLLGGLAGGLGGLAGGLAPLGGSARAQAGATYTVAVVPQFPAADLHRDWLPLLDRIGQAAGVTLKLQLSPGIPRFEAEVLAGGPDFAYLNPYHQLVAMRAQGYVPLVREQDPLTGILVVRKDDPIRSVHELQGRTVAFPAPNAFGASLLMRALLTEREKIPFTPAYAQTHGNVYRQVIRGHAAAGGGVNHTLAQEREEVRANLRVLMQTPGAAPHPLSAHPRVDARVQAAVAGALLRLADDAAGQALLKGIQMPRPVRADHGRDYQPLHAWRLDRYVVAAPPA